MHPRALYFLLSLIPHLPVARLSPNRPSSYCPMRQPKLREYVDDTEDYINIMLDDKQNQLLEMGVMLSTATLVFSAGIVVVGVFGMNIGISLYDESTPRIKFWETTIGTIGGCAILYVLAIGWGKKRGLLQ